MRSMYGPDTLLLASKKPRIIELIERSKSLTVAEIKQLPEKPDTIRGLLLIKEFGQEKKGTVAEKIADAMEKSSIKSSGNLLDDCEIWKINNDIWFPIRLTMLEIKSGWYWGKSKNNIIISDNIIEYNNAQQQYNLLVANSTFICNKTVTDLKEFENERRAKLL